MDPPLSVITVGVNWFIAREAIKLTADLGYGFKEVGEFWEDSGAGWLEDRPGENGQVVLRSQFQLLF